MGKVITFWRLSVIGLGLVTSGASRGQTVDPVILPAQNLVLAGLKKTHPRLLIPNGDFAALKVKIKADPLQNDLYANLKKNADSLLRASPNIYVIPDGLRLLATSRSVLERVYALAFVYYLEGDAKYADRAWQELAAAAAFPDWNAQRHFLDVGEMCHAFAIGYDWLYNYLTPTQRQTLRKAMVDFAFKAGLDAYQKNSFWVNAKHNWNMVCNGGLIMGALAIGDEEKPISDSLMYKALVSLTQSGSIEEFGPDGGWGEGPAYWGYAMRYLVVSLSGMKSALSTDFGIAKIPGVSEAGFFPIYTNGPNNRSFNYADAHDEPGGGASMFFLASTYNQPAFSGYAQEHSMSTVQDLVWNVPGKTATAAALPLDRHFEHAGAVLMRSAWDDTNAVSIGFKGGDNKFNHSHLDLGSFVLDANGIRWAGDLGPDDYNMPGYFDTLKKRWTYYRTRAEGHNTFLLNPGLGPDQDLKAAAPVTRFSASLEEAVAIADLSGAYTALAEKVVRGMALTHNRQWVMVQDEVTGSKLVGAKPAEAWWFMHTIANIKVDADGVSAVLDSKGQRLLARILSPAGAKFTAMKPVALPSSPVTPDSVKENANVGWTKLTIHLSGMTDLRLTVVFVPLKPGQADPTSWPKVMPLGSTWPSGIVGIVPQDNATHAYLRPWSILPGRIHIQLPSGTPFKAVVVSLEGQVVARFWGSGEALSPRLAPGLYAISLRSGVEPGSQFSSPALVRIP